MDGYDQQTCCSRSGVKDDCLPMCQYNASLSQVRQLTNLCKDDLVKVTKCAAGTFFLINRSWHISTTPNTTKNFFYYFQTNTAI